MDISEKTAAMIDAIAKKWKDLMSAFGSDTVTTVAADVEKLIKRIQELESKPHKVKVEVDELEKAKGEIEQLKGTLGTLGTQGVGNPTGGKTRGGRAGAPAGGKRAPKKPVRTRRRSGRRAAGAPGNGEGAPGGGGAGFRSVPVAAVAAAAVGQPGPAGAQGPAGLQEAVNDVRTWFGKSFSQRALDMLADGQLRGNVAPQLRAELEQAINTDGRIPQPQVVPAATQVIDDIIRGIGADQIKGVQKARAGKLADEISDYTTIDEETDSMAATMQATGGLLDKYGRFRRIAPQDRQAVLTRRISEYLHTTGMGAEEANAVGETMASQSMERVGTMARVRRFVAADWVHKNSIESGIPVREMLGVNNKTQMNQMISAVAQANTLQAVQNLWMKAEANDRKLRQLGNLAAAVNKKTQGGGRRGQ